MLQYTFQAFKINKLLKVIQVMQSQMTYCNKSQLIYENYTKLSGSTSKYANCYSQIIQNSSENYTTLLFTLHSWKSSKNLSVIYLTIIHQQWLSEIHTF